MKRLILAVLALTACTRIVYLPAPVAQDAGTAAIAVAAPAPVVDAGTAAPVVAAKDPRIGCWSAKGFIESNNGKQDLYKSRFCVRKFGKGYTVSMDGVGVLNDMNIGGTVVFAPNGKNKVGFPVYVHTSSGSQGNSNAWVLAWQTEQGFAPYWRYTGMGTGYSDGEFQIMLLTDRRVQ
jgi:hypothetical protein